MKRKLKMIILVLINLIMILFTCKKLKTNHKIKYTVKNYKITESFYIENKKHTYNFIIKNKKNTYSFTINNNISKRKKIIKDIKIYKKNNLTCIIPIYKTKRVKKNIYCLKNNLQTSNYLLKDSKEFQKIVKENKIKEISTSSKTTKYKEITIYKNNINKNEVFLIWNYKGLYVIKNNNYLYHKILNRDLYDNVMSTTISEYYYLFDNRDVDGIKDVYYYNIDKDKLKKITLEESINKSAYINGNHKNYIYITDIKSKDEYRLNIKNNKLEKVNKDDTNYLIYKNNKEKRVNKREFFNQNNYFSNYEIINTSISSEKIREEKDYYYYYENNGFYKQLVNGNKELLFIIDSVNDWKIINNNILIINNGIMYRYNEENGLEKILKSNELKYNYLNIYSYYNK